MKNRLFLLLLAASLLAPSGLAAQCCDFSVSQQDDPGGATFGVALGDIDGDGDLDAVVAYAYEGLQVYLGDGAGNFTYQTALAQGDDFFGVYLVDVDFDNDPDIIASAFYNSQNTKVFKNNGSGGFSLFQSLPTNLGSRNIGVGDLDGDNDPDLFIPASSGGSGQVWKNNGIGFFVNFQTLNGAIGEDAALGDLDGDGDLDAWVARNSSGAGNTVWLNNGAGNFTDTGQSLGLNSSQAAALGDLDGDGDLDAVEANWGEQQVWLNDGAGVFTMGMTIPNNNYAKSVKLADNDLDGDLDIFLGYYGDGTQVWSNDGSANFSMCYESQSMYTHNMTLGDIDNDGRIDIYVGYFSNTDGDFALLNRTAVATITPDGPLAFCRGGSVTLNANAGASYLWNTDAETQSITISEPGEYWVIVTDNAGCNAVSALTTVVVYDLPVVTYNETNTQVFDNTPIFALTPGSPDGGIYSGPGVMDNTFNPAAAGLGEHLVEYAYTDPNGCSASDTSLIVVEMNTGVREMGERLAIRVFPNPAKDYLFVEVEKPALPADYWVLDALGKELMRGRFAEGTTVLAVGDLAPGVYFLRWEGGMVMWMK